MSKELCFWILMLIWLVFGLWTSLAKDVKAGIMFGGHSLLMFILLLLLGWQAFGKPVH